MILTDYHLHTDFSPDSNAPIEDMIKKAIALNFTEIAITDHQDYPPEAFHYDAFLDTEAYIDEFIRLKEIYAEKINLLLGVEVGLIRTAAAETEEFLSKYPFEFVIGSVHDTPSAPLWQSIFFEGKDKKTAYMEYFTELLSSIRVIDGFCVCGHIDYISRYGIYEDNSLLYADYADIIDEILKELISRGKGLEINTSGYRYKLNQTHPQLDILKRYHQLGGEIVTIGSDAHQPKYIGECFNVAESILTQSGFKAYTLFRNMKPVWIDL